MVAGISTQYLPAWGVNPAIFLAYLLGFYVIGRIVVKPLVSQALARTSEHLARPLSRLALYLTTIVGIGVGLTAAGYGNVLTAFGTILAGATIAIGFAMRDTLEAFVAGVFLFIDKPFVIGDWIEWNDNAGRVTDITIRTTKVETFNNEMLTVPNNQLTKTVVKNPVANDKLRVTTTFGIGYDDDIAAAKEHIHDAVTGIDDVLEEPAPDVKVVQLGGSSVDIVARYWIEPRRGTFIDVRDAVLHEVKDRLDAEGIDIPYPTRTIAGDTLSVEQE